MDLYKDRIIFVEKTELLLSSDYPMVPNFMQDDKNIFVYFVSLKQTGCGETADEGEMIISAGILKIEGK